MPLWLFAVLFFAMFVQGLTGFGSAMIAMPFLITALGLDVASPLFALVYLPLGLLMFARYRRDFSFDAIWPLIVTVVIAIPIGATVIRALPESSIRVILGLIIISYAIYSLIGPRIPELKSRAWAFGLGFASGLLSGSYNMGGPPYIVYGTSQRWSPREFKGNLQILFVVNTTVLLLTHTLAGRVTGEVLRDFVLVFPIMVIGQYIGFKMDKYLDARRFRVVVLVLLLLIGLRMITS